MGPQLRYVIGRACARSIARCLLAVSCLVLAGRFVVTELVPPLFIILPVLFAVAEPWWAVHPPRALSRRTPPDEAEGGWGVTAEPAAGHTLVQPVIIAAWCRGPGERCLVSHDRRALPISGILPR